MARTGFDRSLAELKEKLLLMGGRVTEAVHQAVDSLARQDLHMARRVIDGDDAVDDLAYELEEDCLRLIALQQPIAKDLRAVAAAYRMTTDLERIADHAVNIAEIAVRIGGEPLIKPLIDIPRMAGMVEEMVRDSLAAYVQGDPELAQTNCRRDEEVDRLYESLFDELMGFILAGGESRRAAQALNLLFAARYLERVGDHATNIGERVIFMVTGKRERY
ncbi:MAG: phosphate signaling complex protein PhoU [Patescibacteria group bacterium]